MIATGLVFALGALVASLLALLFLPFFWRKAQRLARREFDATIPATVKEMRAEIDSVRAASAFDVRRQEIRLAEVQTLAASQRAEAGRTILENGDLRAREAELLGELEVKAASMRVLEDQFEALTGERNALHETRQDLRLNLQKRTDELNALTEKYRMLADLSDEQRLRLAAAETRIMELSALRAGRPVQPGSSAAAPREWAPAPLTMAAAAPDATAAAAAPPTSEAPSPAPAPAADLPAQELVPIGSPHRPAPVALPAEPREAISGSNRLRAAIAARAGTRRSPSTSENADIRERISDIAARVIHRQVEAGGPNSPVARIITGDETPSPSGAPTLAERVRRLMAEDAPSEPAPPVPAAVEPAPPVQTIEPAPLVAEPDERPVTPPRPAAKRSGGGRSRPKSRR